VIETRELLGLRPKSTWRFFAAQPFVYWAMCAYLFIEYVRPQELIAPLHNVPVGQIVLGAALLAFLGSGRWFRMHGLGSWLLLAFTAVIVVSSFAAYATGVAIGQWRLWFSWVVIYFLIISVVNTEQRMVFYLLLWMLFHYYMSQGGARQLALRGFTFSQWGVVGAPGWFYDPGEFGIAMCMLVAVSWHYYLAARPYLTKWRKVLVLGMPVTAVLCIVGSSSRGAVLGLGALGVWSLVRAKHRVRTALATAVLATIIWLLVPQGFRDRFQTAGDDYTSQQRKVYWKNGLAMARDHPLLGVGFGNWTVYYTAFYKNFSVKSKSLEGRVQVPHNIFIECVAELGYSGLFVFALLICATLWVNYQTRKVGRAGPGPPNDFLIQMGYGLDGAMISYLVCGFFVTVLYYPFFWINLAFTVALNAIARRSLVARRAPGALRNGGPVPRP